MVDFHRRVTSKYDFIEGDIIGHDVIFSLIKLHHTLQTNFMEAVLQAERDKSTLSHTHLGHFLYGKDYYQVMQEYLQSGTTITHSPNIYNRKQLDLMLDAYRYLPHTYMYNMHHIK